jgi:Zn-dependent peptidase ImmA (M78 family)/transcriptional regulator with XRE-family HTH domain
MLNENSQGVAQSHSDDEAGSLGVRVKNFEVPIVAPGTLRWARETSGKSVVEVARKLDVETSLVTDWERGVACPTLGQLEKLAVQYKRCLAALLLNEPPSESPPPAEYRTLPELHRHPLGEDVFLAIRRARGVQSSFRELRQALGGDDLPELPQADLDDEPWRLAHEVSSTLGLGADRPKGTDHDVLRSRVRAVEAAGVLVLQLGMPVEQSRAFSLADRDAPVLVINSHDGPRPRSFSLFHELAHLLLGRSGTCGEMAVFSRSGSNVRATEAFCNQFAGCVLVPSAALLEDPVVGQHGSSPVWLDDELSRLATRFRASRQVILRRLLSLELTSHRFYDEKQRDLEKQAASGARKGGGRSSPPERALRENGTRYASLVLDAYRQDVVSPLGAADMLGLKYKHFTNLEALVSGLGA